MIFNYQEILVRGYFQCLEIVFIFGNCLLIVCYFEIGKGERVFQFGGLVVRVGLGLDFSLVVSEVKREVEIKLSVCSWFG